MGYDKKIAEEELKNKVASDYFTTKNFDSTQIIGKIDFCIAKKINKKDKYLKTQNNFDNKEFEAEYYLWAEAKKGNKHDFIESFVQLILTIGKGRIYDKHLPPAFLGEFDAEQIAFLPYHKIMDVFSQNDFNWNVTPSNHNTKEFKQLYEMVKNTLEEESFIFKFGKDDKEIEDFIKNNFGKAGVENNLSKTQIDKNNFVNIYSKWLVSVKNSISVDWDMAKKNGIIDADFYLADLLSENNLTLIKKLFVILKTDHYELDRKIDDMGLITSKQSHFYDNQKAHKEFWKRYHRPPKTEYWDYIINRRDLLVPQDIRERKGSFFTPQIWVEKSQDYIAEVLGESWQDEYYIWDLAAGTGNLLAGLVNKYNIFASTIDQADVDIMLERVDNGANLLKSHIFKFDFLNDDFSKLPKELKNIIDEKPEKLVIYINPPYAEHLNKKEIIGKGKAKVGIRRTNISEDYEKFLAQAKREIFAQFFMRIYKEIPNCILASFSKLKYINSANFIQFRKYFKAKFLKGFICPAYTFDNVKGKFPIGFLIWDTKIKEKIKNITVDIYDVANKPDNNGQLPIVSKSQKGMQETNGSQRKSAQGVTTPCCIGKKNFYNNTENNINQWRAEFPKDGYFLGYIISQVAADIQHNSQVAFLSKPQAQNCLSITDKNLILFAIYLSVRQVIEPTWINDRDQFLYPNYKWEEDLEFQSDCLAFTLFHGQNRITSEEGINHWIPFSEAEVGAKDSFESRFMKDFIDGKIKPKETKELLMERRSPKSIKFSKEAKDIFEAGRELWKYYHKHDLININASYYDIRKFFQGVDSKSGRMNNKSIDETYNKLIGNLRERMKILSKKIEPKIYEFGFLKK